MINFYESFIRGQATCEVMKEIDPCIEAAGKTALRLATPAGLSILIAVHPVAAPLAQEAKNLFAKSPTPQTQTVKSNVGDLVLTVQTAETQKPPFQQTPKPSYAPGLWNLIVGTTGATGDLVQTYIAYSPVERSLQKITIPNWPREESNLPNQPAPAFYGVRIV